MELDILQHKRKSDEAEEKFKDLKLLFDATCSDRNLCNKNLLEITVSDMFLLLKYLTS